MPNYKIAVGCPRCGVMTSRVFQKLEGFQHWPCSECGYLVSVDVSETNKPADE